MTEWSCALTTSTTTLRSAGPRVAAIVLSALILAIAAIRQNGLPPGPLAAHAKATLDDLLREQVPHPVESAANKVVRDRILARFRQLGYSPVIQRAWSCGGWRHRCDWVENILVLPQTPGDVVIGAAHYDSTPNGPGASDDGAGVVAMLEAASILRNERFRNPIGFVITDGEEAGLLGAEAFVRDPRSQRVRAVVNVEDRGTSGPSYLFETSRNNRDLAPLFNALRKPMTSSLFFTAYELMPNDTDVSVFKRWGKIAVNFAAIGDVQHYHKRTDDLAHVDMRTLEHHCENAVAMLRALGNAGLAPMRAGNDVWFDVLGFFVVWWPEWLTIWIAIASFAVWIGKAAAGRRFPWKDARAMIVAIVIAAAIGILALMITRHRLAHPMPLLVLMWIAGFACGLLAMRRRSWEGRSLVWHAVAIVLALVLPGISFLFLVPAIAMHGRWIAAPVAAILFFPILLSIYTALAALSLPVIAVLTALFASTLA